ncbi:methylthioribulose 1-phosphate dehydratase [Kaistia geumhonensis]|uniref:Methylthioribulose-1-phosphate dehydratase n=1 Tax=Kaistia geumhonensis TaxID=410839 RepID=A0ABU0M4P3_9HYPH|nr:methylthioribulose 1-phosphate dehydratase [Kaistia geumhonensis]MCX5478883.1 methylthioribulose 1-phosphate dehydratase [Kaistia geumhonensis]MDQ0515898.1 methylthioribulose-1-phosphate dehydratase [Kaistia geumhonensis]
MALDLAQQSEPDEAQVTAAVEAVISAGRMAAARHWVPATSGNFSARIDAHRIAITRSGVDKGALEAADILIQPLDAPLLPRSSAEAPLHIALYRRRPELGAIFHVHGPASTVLSRGVGTGTLRLQGWELQKALAGITSHEEAVDVPVFANDQDTARLADLVEARLAAPPHDARLAPGYLLAGHGLYAWGASPREAARHLEALETLFEFELSYRRFTP